MLDFAWDDTGDAGFYVQTPDGKQVCVEAQILDGEQHRGYMTAIDAMEDSDNGVALVRSVRTETKARLSGAVARAHIEKLADLQRTCKKLAVNEQQERLREFDVLEGRADRWVL
jgi:hypothetical protein